MFQFNPNPFSHINASRTINGHLGLKIVDTFIALHGTNPFDPQRQMGLMDYPLFPVGLLLNYGVRGLLRLLMAPLKIPVFGIFYGIIMLIPILVIAAALIVTALAIEAANIAVCAALTVASLPILLVTQLVTSIMKYSRGYDSGFSFKKMGDPYSKGAFNFANIDNSRGRSHSSNYSHSIKATVNNGVASGEDNDNGRVTRRTFNSPIHTDSGSSSNSSSRVSILDDAFAPQM